MGIRTEEIHEGYIATITAHEQLPGCWVAVDADRYDGPGSPIGSGFSENEAVCDLICQLQEAAA